MTKIDAITFDLWKTLLEPANVEGYLIETLKEYCIEKEKKYSFTQLKTALTISQATYKKNRDNFPYPHFYTRNHLDLILNQIGQKEFGKREEKLLDDFEKASLKVLPKVIASAKEILQILSQEYKIGLISDTGITPGKNLVQTLEYFNLKQYFTRFIFSDEVGFYKPNPQLFKVALAKLNSKRNESIHIGDYLHTDVIGAHKYGMKTIWINRHEPLKKIVEVSPDYEVEKLADILPIIKGFAS